MLPRMTETDAPSSVAYKIPTHADFLIAYSTVPGRSIVIFFINNFQALINILYFYKL